MSKAKMITHLIKHTVHLYAKVINTSQCTELPPRPQNANTLETAGQYQIIMQHSFEATFSGNYDLKLRFFLNCEVCSRCLNEDMLS